MASNPTPDRIEELLALCEDLGDGIHQHEAAISIKQNTEAVFRTDLTAARTASDTFNAATGAEPAAYSAQRTADSNAKGFLAAAIGVLKNYLGSQWSQAWEATGLPGQSTGIPRTLDDRFNAIAGLRAYLTATPAYENAPLNVTAARADALFAALGAARQTVANAMSLTQQCQQAREQKIATLRRRYRGTVDEIGQLIGSEDARWYDFGLNRPADPATPGQVATVHVAAGGPGILLISWDGARRADYFRVYKQEIGTDAAPVFQARTSETTLTLTALPTGKTLRITLAGANPAGEGPQSSPVDVVVG